MIGIVSYGGYIPTLRVDRKIIADAWNRRAIKGERSLANNDEDSLTMATEAGLNCLGTDIPAQDVDGLFFATTTAPYKEKMNSALIAVAMDLGRKIRTVDFGNSLRSGTAALKAGIDAVKAGSLKNVIITSSDQRSAYPISDDEQMFGDGAASVMVGKENLVATLEGSCSINDEITDVWRNSENDYVKKWEGRFILGQGYHKNMQEVIHDLFKKNSLKPSDISTAILPAPNDRACKTLARAVGFNEDTKIQDTLLSNVGYCGTAQPLLMLCQAIENSNPGDLLLLASYSNGADAFIFKVTKNITNKVNRYSIKTLLDNKLMLPSYGQFLSYKEIVKPLPGEPFRLMPSASSSWREQNSILRCHGSKCQSCGTTSFPIQRICQECRAKDDFEEVRIADLQGEIFTFTRDNFAGRSDDPVVVQTVAEFTGGVRFYGLMTDCDPETPALGMPVELTFRRIYEGAGFHNYFWKLRPVRK